MNNSNLKDISGEKIRQQLFNIPIYWLIIAFLVASTMALAKSISNHAFYSGAWIEQVTKYAKTAVIFLVAFIILSLLNRFLFGKIVCILNEEGIHHKYGTVKWNEIERIEYEIEHSTRFAIRYNYANIIRNNGNENVTITHAPYFLLAISKRYNPGIKTCISKRSKTGELILYIVMFALAAFLPFILP